MDSLTEISPKASPANHDFISLSAYSHRMRGAFVVQLGPETKPTEGRFEGWVEEVDSCIELRFRSTQELLNFLGQHFELTIASSKKVRAEKRSEQDTPKKKSTRRKKDMS